MSYEPDLTPGAGETNRFEGREPSPEPPGEEMEDTLGIASAEEIEQLDAAAGEEPIQEKTDLHEDPWVDGEERQTQAEPAQEAEPAQQEQHTESPELAALRERARQGDELQEKITQAAQMVHEQKMQELREEDPQAYYDQRIQALEQQHAQQQQVAMYNQLNETVTRSEQAYAANNPDYYDAVEQVKDYNRAAIRQANPTATDEAVEQLVLSNATTFAYRAVQAGKDPAEAAHTFAKQFIQAQGLNQQGQPAQAQPVQQQAPAKPRMTSLSATNGRTGGGRGRKITFDQFANLDTDSAAGRELFEKITGDENLARQIEQHGFVYV